MHRLGPAVVKAAVRQSQGRARSGAIATEAVADTAVALLPRTASGTRSVINATGVLLHTNLDRTPVSAAARRAVWKAAGPPAASRDDAPAGPPRSRYPAMSSGFHVGLFGTGRP